MVLRPFNFWVYKLIKVDGYGRFGTGIIRAMVRRGLTVRPGLIEDLDMPAWYLQAQGINLGLGNVTLAPPHHLKVLPGRQISFTMHEADRLPDEWAFALNDRAQAVIVPSNWMVAVVYDSNVTRKPIFVVPGGIDPEECPILKQNTDRPFTFMCLADRGGRKGHELTWMAFYKAFGNNPDVRLILKCRPGSLPPISFDSDYRVSIWRADVDNVSDIYSQADCFVFPTKGEGYGMPPREAAASGLPVICTNYSGVADDIQQWAIPITTYKLVESQMDGCEWAKWANPDLDELVGHMKWVYENQSTAKENALGAAEWLRKNHTWDHSAARLENVLEQLL